MDTIDRELTVDQKFALVLLALRQIRPFYSCAYEVLNKVENNDIDTMGVSTDTLYYNYDFADKTSYEEFLFIILHEICHICLMHVARRENRDNKLWNVACDLYSNSILCEEFGLQGPGSKSSCGKYNIHVPMGILYCSSIDTDTDYVESIYESMYKQAEANGYNKSNLNGDEDNNRYAFSYTGSNKDIDNNSEFNTVIDKNTNTDLIDNGDDQSAKEQQSSKIMNDITVRSEMSSTGIGVETGKMQSLVKKLLESKVDWKRLLKKYLIKATSTDSSFSSPDKRMYYQKSIYPGQVLYDGEQIKGVKVCVDTSGSISNSDLAHFCGQVYGLTKQYKIEAELIYWDARIASKGEFKGYKEFERVDCFGGGGTDPSVLFKYFDSKECKVKPYVTIIFTDGYFDLRWVTPKIKKKYKDCIWVMTRGYNKGFEPPFGKKAIAKFE